MSWWRSKRSTLGYICGDPQLLDTPVSCKFTIRSWPTAYALSTGELFCSNEDRAFNQPISLPLENYFSAF